LKVTERSTDTTRRVVHHHHERGACPRHARANRANRAVTDRGGFVVPVAKYLSEHERLALVVRQRAHQEVDLGYYSMIVHRASSEFTAPGASLLFDRIRTTTTCDRDDPSSSVAFCSKRMQTSQRTKIGFLNLVIDVLAITHVGAKPRHVQHGVFDEPSKSGWVAILCGEEISSRIGHQHNQGGAEDFWKFTWNFSGRRTDLFHMMITPATTSRRRRKILGFALCAMVGSLLAACGGDSGSESSRSPAAEAGFTIVVSDRPIADLVERVAGTRADVVSIVPLGANGHTYEPVPSNAQELSRADVYIENGLGLNDVVSAFAEANYPSGTPHYELSEVIPPDEVLATDTPEAIAAHGHAHSFNAHFWPDPNYARLYTNRIVEILSAHDPEGTAGYQERGSALATSLGQLDAAFRAALSTIPASNRKLVVYHDSWSYFGRRYNLPVVGAIQPTDFSEPSAAELRATIDQVRAQGVPAFFGSEVFPSDVLDAIQAESGARYVADLSDDKLPGEPGSPEHSYAGMMIENTRTIVTALGGDPSALDALVP
jgi:ABC-type Zn uptake system ZnuABC Zn-binding protein ZnuA